MATRPIQGNTWLDDALEDGVVRISVDPGRSRARTFMTLPTYRAVARVEGGLQRLRETFGGQPGTFPIPRGVIEPEAREDLLLGLSLVDPEPSEYCVYPPCSLPSTQVHRDGFPLCDIHGDLLRTWDDLVT